MTTLTELEGRETALLGHAKAHGFPMLRSTRDEKNANGLPEVSDDSEDSDKFETINLTGSRKPLSVDRLSDFELGHSTISDHEISGHEADNLNPTWMSTGVSAKDGGLQLQSGPGVSGSNPAFGKIFVFQQQKACHVKAFHSLIMKCKRSSMRCACFKSYSENNATHFAPFKP